MLKILQARFQQYVNHKLPDVQAGFRKDRGTRAQIAKKLWTILKEMEYQIILPVLWETCTQVKKQQNWTWSNGLVQIWFKTRKDICQGKQGKRTRDQITNIYWIIEKPREFQKTICFCFIVYAKFFA